MTGHTDVMALESMTRALVGISLESLDPLAGKVSITQFRLLLALDHAGALPSSQLAARLGSLASSVTRLVDRLQADGFVQRGKDESNRSIVTVQITPEGHKLVASVLRRRHRLLASTLRHMSDHDREALVRGAAAFAALSEHALELSPTSPLPL